MTSKLRLGTRGSRLALAQAEAVRSQLLALRPGSDVEIVVVKTSGDLGKRERVGAFVGEIQDALLDYRVDVGLHCLKDLPTRSVSGLRLSAYLEREDPRDTLISGGYSVTNLPSGAIVGTGSVRRSSQLAARRPDLTFKPLVGNVDTRLRKLIAGEYDAIVLAIAGLLRLGLMQTWEASEFQALSVLPLSPDEMLPSAGQAVLTLETREEDEDSHLWISGLDHPASRVSAIAERAFLNAFGGGCSLPVASLVRPTDQGFLFEGLVAKPDGSRVWKDTLVCHESELIVGILAIAETMKREGAMDAVLPRGGVL